MSESLQILLGAGFLIAVFILTRVGIAWKMARTSHLIIKDLEARGATDMLTAEHLPYAKQSVLRIGMRDYHSKALEYLINDGVVAKTGEGKYYLTGTTLPNEQQKPSS
jgi:hypothetical protein